MRYLTSGVERTLFQWILAVVKYTVGVETGPSYESFLPPTVSRTLWVSIFWVLMSYTMRLYVAFLSWETLCLCMKKHVYVPSIYRIPWERRPISFAIFRVHFGLLGLFIRCLYSWYFPVSGHMNVFIWPRWIVTYTVVLLVCDQSSPVLCTEYARTATCGGIFGWTVATWLVIILWPFIRLDMVLYLCNRGMLHVIPSYWCVSDERASVSSGMTWGLVWDGCRGAHPGVMVTVYFTLPLWHGTGSGGTVVSGCCVIPCCCGGSGVSTLRSCAGGGGAGDCGTSVLNMAASWLSGVFLLSKLRYEYGWCWVLKGFR